MIDTQLIKSFAFFSSFTDEEVLKLLPFTTIKNFAPGEKILVENAPNDKLYFLAVGAVDILVNDTQVASIDNLGEVLGEMSFAINSPATATVIAKKPSMFIVVSYEDIANPSKTGNEAVLSKLYQSTSKVLAQKLIMTNALAKTFKQTVS